MNRHTLNLAVFALAAVVLTGAALSWANAQRRNNRKTSAATAQLQNRAEAATDESGAPDTRRDVFISARRAPNAAKFGEGTWLNSQPTTLENLRGRVVLVDFWTFGCYNCRNTLPTLKRLDAQYRNKGLTIVGVHAPESDYEKGIENVREAVQRLGIKYPVVTDNDYATWRAYGVQAWPTVVILDKQGRIRFTHIGEGYYEQQEQIIQKLLAETDVATRTAEDKTDLSQQRGVNMEERVVKSEEEWRAEMTPQQFHVMREKGTERAFTGEYDASKKHGMYVCSACGNPLFSSEAKFDSGTGWPSFYQPVSEQSVGEHVDQAYGMTRTEVVCARCASHLGHVFKDGPRPTGLRYCMNSVALKLNENNSGQN
ncbi:MAG: peptide-methionine (R)-S-oxide reductase MsrB [Pyrinomonadaceae bacterium]|nr:peptide-methionine (R)-S-oxide reductase MsrB [Pyrinomonadaceae bacterium]